MGQVRREKRKPLELASLTECVPVNVISCQLSHANSSVTTRYLDDVALAAVIEMMQRGNADRTGEAPQ